MDAVTDYEFELLVLRYIGEDTGQEFTDRMSSWGISVLTRPKLPTPASAPLRYWDYPDFDREAKDVRLVTTKVADKGGIRLNSLDLIGLEVISLRDVPKHFPFGHILEFLFRGKVKKKNSKPEMLLELISRTQDAKQFTDALCSHAPYRPVYWFLPELSEDLRGLRGTVNELAAADGSTIRVERAFPEASYAVYGPSPYNQDLRMADLALVSVVAHLVERGFRPRMYDLTASIYKEVGQLSGPAANLPRSVRDLSQRIEALLGIQQKIRPITEEFFSIRKDLIRIKGLVQRVRQVCGDAQKKNLFDLVCDDAITSIEDEITMSQEEISTHLQDIGDRLQTVYRQLNDHYGQLNSRRTQNLQRIGLYLQATGAAFVAFQMSNALLPPFPKKSWVILIITIIAFAAMYLGLDKMLAEEPSPRETLQSPTKITGS
jgi:hypothetical protein